MSTAPGFMRASSRAPMRPVVAGSSGTCSETTSAEDSNSSRPTGLACNSAAVAALGEAGS